MQVKEVMTADPACCVSEMALSEVAKIMVDHDCGAIPVVESNETKLPIGVITDRDIVCRTVARGLNPLDLTVANCFSKPCVTVTPDMSVEECSRVLEENQIRRVPVVDAGGSGSKHCFITLASALAAPCLWKCRRTKSKTG